MMHYNAASDLKCTLQFAFGTFLPAFEIMHTYLSVFDNMFTGFLFSLIQLDLIFCAKLMICM